MSENIPFEVQMEIMIRLPVKSLFQFRSVSKTWKSLIDSPQLIADYNACTTRPQRLFIRCKDSPESEQRFLSIIDDDTFPRNKFALSGPISFAQFDKLYFVGSSSGLVCFHGQYTDPGGLFPNEMAVIWNPSLKKSIAVHVPFTLDMYVNTLGFGVCPKTSEPVVVIFYCTYFSDRVDVFKLSYGVWKTPRGNLPRKSIQFCWFNVSLELDGMIYWNAYDRISNRGLGDYNLIMSFDMEDEEFTEVNLPHELANCSDMSISKLRGSLVVLQWCQVAEKPVYGMWMMDHGDLITFTKLFNINIPCASAKSVLGFKKNGELILKKEINDCDNLLAYCDKLATLEVYEPRSEHTTNALGICGVHLSLCVSFYTETLILLDQSDGSIFDLREVVGVRLRRYAYWSRKARYGDKIPIVTGESSACFVVRY